MKFSDLRRIYSDSPPAEDSVLEIGGGNFHYLKNVLRLKEKSLFRIFNGSEGEFLAEIESISKKSYFLRLKQKLRDIFAERPLELALSSIKPDKFLEAADIATQLGITSIVSLSSDRSNFLPPKEEKLKKRLIEATEQCERLSPPVIGQTKNLADYIGAKSRSDEIIIFADEKAPYSQNIGGLDLGERKVRLIIGPEGGWSPEERRLATETTSVNSVSLSANVLRAEVAVAAALAQITVKFR